VQEFVLTKIQKSLHGINLGLLLFLQAYKHFSKKPAGATQAGRGMQTSKGPLFCYCMTQNLTALCKGVCTAPPDSQALSLVQALPYRLLRGNLLMVRQTVRHNPRTRCLMMWDSLPKMGLSWQRTLVSQQTGPCTKPGRTPWQRRRCSSSWRSSLSPGSLTLTGLWAP
jgi:hypothetical protein